MGFIYWDKSYSHCSAWLLKKAEQAALQARPTRIKIKIKIKIKITADPRWLL
jgi:hypothetical protein